MRLSLGAAGICVFGLLTATMSGGCGGGVLDACYDTCDELSDCEDVDQDCNSCRPLADDIEGTGCDDQTITVLDCIAEAGCGADVEAVCAPELSAFYGCLRRYCTEHATDRRCPIAG